MIPKIGRRKVSQKGLRPPASKSSSAFLQGHRTDRLRYPAHSLVTVIGNILLEPCGKLGEFPRRELLNRQFKFRRRHIMT